MVITSCPSLDDCTLSIAYNNQMPLCESTMPADARCRDLESLCVADPDFSFDLSPSSSNPSFTQIPISSLLPSHTLVTSSTAFRGSCPTPPQIGDFNIDGYPDLLVLTSSKSGRDKQAVILQSRPCEKVSCTEEEIKHGRRAFRVLIGGAEALSKITDVESATWVDIDDDVRRSLTTLLVWPCGFAS